MCKKLTFLSLVFAFAFAATAQAATIMIVSDSSPTEEDASMISFLEDLGHTVDTRGMTDACVEGNNPFNDPTLSAALNDADLIIVSRRTNSGAYDGDTSNWNTLETPILLMSGYLTRSSRWNWTPGGSGNAGTAITDMTVEAGQESHPFLAGLTGPVQLFDWSAAGGTAPKGVYLPNDDFVAGSTLIGRFDGRPMLADIPKGTAMNNGDIAGERRVFFGHWGYDNIQYQFTDYITDDYKTVLTNIIGVFTGPNPYPRKPDPANGANVPPMGTNDDGSIYMLMSFDPGDGITSHNAYFSDNYDDVANHEAAASIGAPPFPAMPTSYYVGLDDANLPDYAREEIFAGTTYYWTVVESDGVEDYAGPVWSYTIIPEHAWDPIPEDGDAKVNPDPNITTSWQMGAVTPDGQTLSYNVYYGTVLADVEAETSAVVTVTDPTAELGPLEANTTYYWKVNTVLTLTRPPFTETVIPGEIWQFTTLPIAPIVDPNLVGWWKLDGDFGDLAFDWSGHLNHGMIVGDPAVVPGEVDSAMDFDGSNDYVAIENLQYNSSGLAGVTVASWIRTIDGGDQVIVSFDRNEYYRLEINGNGGGTGQVGWDIMTDAGQIDMGSTIRVDDGEWHHIAGVFDSGTAIAYVDGANDGEASNGATYGSGNTRFGYLCVGSESTSFDGGKGPTNYFDGSLDDVRIYDYALSEQDIKVLAGRLNATSPDPANGGTDVPRTATLSWSPGVFAAASNGNVLYYGEDAGSVADRTATSVTLTSPSYTLPLMLDLGATLYWAVDTVNGVDTWAGDVWSFTTTNWLSVDDMETYTPWTTPGNNIFEAYRDGLGNCTAGNGNDTGANLTENLDATFVFEGSQSMKYDYDNDGLVYNPCTMAQSARPHLYSKIEAQVAGLPGGVGTNWTIQGVKALSLRFYGQAGNVVEPMWVQLSDGTKAYGNKVTYGDYDDEDPAAITEESWHEWFIDMADFGVDLTNVVSLVIGFGTEGSAVAGGAGTVYFDDFRLYTPVCRPSRHTAAMAKLDFAPVGAPDCVVNYEEIDAMADGWLQTDALETGELLLHWKFDETAGTTAIDSSGKDHHGDVNDVNGLSWVNDPERGRCLDFQGGDHVMDNDANTYMNGLRGLTIAAWVKNREISATDQGFIEFRNPPQGNDHRNIRYDAAGASTGGTSLIKCGATVGTSAADETWQEYETASSVQVTTWQHLALTWQSGSDVKVYIDGVEDATGGIQATLMGTTWGYDVVMVGKGSKDGAGDAGWNGLVDDVQIYNYALSEAEINTVKGGGTIAPQSIHYPVASPGDVYEEAAGSGVINFKDYAELLKNWLVEVEYPQ